MITTEGTAHVWLCSHLGGSLIPKVRRISLTAPTSGLNNADHRTATATPLSTEGRNMMVRNTLMPRIFRFRTSESNSPTTRYSGTDITMYFSVILIDSQKYRSVIISRKLSRPTHCRGVMIRHSLKLSTKEATMGISQKAASPISQGERKR